MKLLVDPTGKKMGKTEGNMVNLEEKPNQMFGKIMSWPDEIISAGFELLTDLPSPKTDPREAKAQLAKEVIKICHNQKAAESAEQEFERVFRDKALPAEIPKVAIKEGVLNILNLFS